MANTDIIYRFMADLGTLYDACEYIKDAGACDRCPIKNNCIDEVTVTALADDCPKDKLVDFLYLADDIESYGNEQSYHDWMETQKEREIWEG